MLGRMEVRALFFHLHKNRILLIGTFITNHKISFLFWYQMKMLPKVSFIFPILRRGLHSSSIHKHVCLTPRGRYVNRDSTPLQADDLYLKKHSTSTINVRFASTHQFKDVWESKVKSVYKDHPTHLVSTNIVRTVTCKQSQQIAFSVSSWLVSFQ